MKSILLGIAVLGLVGCNSQAEASFETTSNPEATATPAPTIPTPTATPSSTPEVSVPASVTVAFRLTLTGTVPDDAAFALQTGIVGGSGGANYLCSYYGGYPVCAAGTPYEEAHEFAPGTHVTYRFSRELDPSGTDQEIKSGELTVGVTDQVISVSYDFQP